MKVDWFEFIFSLNKCSFSFVIVRLYEQLHEVREKRDQLAAEMQSQNSESERERLLKQVKDDNIEISRMEKQYVFHSHHYVLY